MGQRKRGAKPVGWAAVAVAALMVAACTGGSDKPDGERTGLETPESLKASLVDGDTNPRLEVSFAETSDAEAYLLALGESDPVRVEPEDCVEGRCEVVLDRSSVGGAESASVTGVARASASEPSEPIDLPAWPELSEPYVWPEDRPVELVVTRLKDGQPVVGTDLVAPGEDVEARIAELEAAEDVLGVGVDAPVYDQTVDPEEEEYPEGLVTWQQEAMGFEYLPESRGAGVNVAVLDHGLQTDHPSLRGADITTANIVDPGKEIPEEHGMAITSMIAGQPAGRVPGIAPQATILSYDIVSDRGSFPDPGFRFTAEGIIQAVDDGADVITISRLSRCLSLGSIQTLCPDDTVRPAVEYAEANGVVVVAAVGDDGDGAEDCPGTNDDWWPAKLPTVIGVGSTNRDGEVWECSPDKYYVDVLAPGYKLRAATVNDGYFLTSGTSLSAPLIAGLIANILAERPDLTPEQIRDLLADATDGTGRIQPLVLLDSVGLIEFDGPVIDPTTTDEVIPFSLRLSLHPGHPARQIVEDIRSEPVLSALPGPGIPRDEVQINGLLAVDADGAVTGTGRLLRTNGATSQSTTRTSDGYSISRVLSGHHVMCPVSYGLLKFEPVLEFGWSVGATVAGQLTEDADGERTVDLTVSLGEGATPERPGELGDMFIARDTLNNCPFVIDEYLKNVALATLNEDPAYREWEHVEERRNRLVPELERFHQELIDSGPFEISGTYTPPPPSSQGAEAGDATDGLLSLELTLGGFRYYSTSR